MLGAGVLRPGRRCPAGPAGSPPGLTRPANTHESPDEEVLRPVSPCRRARSDRTRERAPVTAPSSEELREAIAREEARVARLEDERRLAQGRLDALRGELAALGARASDRLLPLIPEPTRPDTSAEKVTLFRQLFRGRDDLYPKLWTNTTTGRKGYAPACANEWVRGICEKPRVKCGECPNQAFLAVTDQVIRDHLQGRHVVGVYPLLTDETCWLVAADFDKRSWTDDVLAFAETCRMIGVPTAVERSRSGQGAHAWFFFAAPVPAIAARKMACYLLTETMSRRHQLGMESYDRLFPNQDTLPRGGFGNLIALPLQHEPRQAGNTVFVDDRLVPHPDQWAFLAASPTHRSRHRRATRAGRDAGRPGAGRAVDRRRRRRRRSRALDPRLRHGEDPRRASRGRSPEPSGPCWARDSSWRRSVWSPHSSTRSSGWRPSRTRSSTRSSGCASRPISRRASSRAPRSLPSTSPCPGAVGMTSRRSSAARGAAWPSRIGVRQASRSTSGSRAS